MRRFSVHPWPEASPRSECDLVLAAIGYERRARHFCESREPLSRIRAAIAFSEQHELSFRENREWFDRGGYECYECDDADFGGVVDGLVSRAVALSGSAVGICVDISSFSRFRLARIIEVVCAHPKGVRQVDFVYSLAEYCPPPKDYGPVIAAGPVTPRFAGWSPWPNLPIVAIIGLGYEPDKAIGVFEYLEASSVRAFLPLGDDPRYGAAVQEANALLMPRLLPEQLFEYRVDKPWDGLVTLESLTQGVLRSARPVLIPFGPKIFALCCLLVGCLYREAAIWRISGGPLESPVDRVATGRIVGLSVEFQGHGQPATSRGAETP